MRRYRTGLRVFVMVAFVAGNSPVPGSPQTAIDTTVSHSARIGNYWLGGKDNYQVDREVGEQILAFVPELVRSAPADRQLLARAMR